jgi:HEAT repeat protein
LAEFVGDPDASVRQATVEALARLPDPVARQVFAPLRNDPDASVAVAADGACSLRQGPSRAEGL